MHKIPAGFSLLELLLVAGLALTLSMVAAPALLSVREDYRLTGVANELVGRLNNARILAINQSAYQRIQVSTTTAYALQKKSGASWTTTETYSLPKQFTISALVTPEFQTRGNAIPTGTFTVTNPRGKTKQVVVATSGRVYVQ